MCVSGIHLHSHNYRYIIIQKAKSRISLFSLEAVPSGERASFHIRMPHQSRGFFCCDFCKLKLDTFEEARQHEEECQHYPNKSQHQYYPPQEPRVPSHPPGGGYYFPPAAAAASTMVPLPLKSNGIPIIGPNDATKLPSAGDTVACQSFEIFEADANILSNAELRSQHPSLEAGQLGLRCMHCSGGNTEATQSTKAFVFPANAGALADEIQILCDRHLGDCGTAPPQVREVAKQTTEKRRQQQQQKNSQQERGPSLQQEYERNRRALQELCFHFCQRFGIVDKGPNAAGIFFSQPRMDRYGPGSSQGRPGPGDTLAPPDYRTAYDNPYAQGGEGYYPEAAAMPPPSQEGQDPQQQPGAPPHGRYQQPPMPLPYDIPGNFPFYQEPNGSWVCKYCSHIHPQYRDPQYIWMAPNHMPPPGPFIDQHLSMCRAYHQTMPPQHPMFQGPNQSQFPLMSSPQMSGGGYGPPQDWDGSQTQPLPFHPQAGPEIGSQMHAPFPHMPHQMPTNPKYAAAASASAEGSGRGQPRTPMNPAPRPEPTDAAVRKALDYLTTNEREPSFTPGTNESDQLVLDEDKLLLTDYFFHLMKQLKLVRFSESDRKTRGGKREKVQVGFGGLQCIHCADANNSRKFFWSNVDRLANSFAEIPGHVLKCRHCPQPTKDALYQLKQLHPEQMARLPRGSQKVFFRRMWRRLHDEDPQAKGSPDQPSVGQAASADSAEVKSPAEAKAGNDSSPSGTTGSDESILLMQRSTKEAAKALADSTSASLPPSPSSRVLLAIPDDKEWLSDTDCFIRRQIEVFCANAEDAKIALQDRKFPIREGQVGIRCIHCSLAKRGVGARGSGVAYPFSISGIYESVREFQRLHLDTCDNLPPDLKSKLSGMKGSTSLSSVLRKYYVLAAKALGLQDTQEGIRAGADSVPLGTQATAFAFTEGTSISEEMRRSTAAYGETHSPTFTPVGDSKKRKPDETPESSESNKRPHST